MVHRTSCDVLFTATTVVDVLPHQTRNSVIISSPIPLRASILPPSEPQKLKRTRHRWSSLMPLNVARTSPSLPRIAESPISPSLTTAARNDVTSAVLQHSRPTSASTSMDSAAGPEGGAYSSKSASLQVPGRSPLAEKQNVRATQPGVPQPPRTLHANRWSTMYGLKRSTFVQGGSWQGKRGL